MLLSFHPQKAGHGLNLKQTSNNPIKIVKNHKDVNFREQAGHYDTIDNPDLSKKIISECIDNKSYFEIMKHKRNRAESFEGKWPVTFIKPTELAEAGFFYLQIDDKVQCAFCKLVLCSWEQEDNPFEEHKKNSPDCPFLKPAEDVRKNTHLKLQRNPNYCSEYILESTSCSTKPMHPHMADIRDRLCTFKDWSYPYISIHDLAECGLYYAGTKDFAICFFCGKVQGFWEPTDIPLKEHERLFPNCGYLRILKNQPTLRKTEFINSAKSVQKKPISLPVKQVIIKELMESEIVREAKEIFPQALIEKAIYQHIADTGDPFTSLPQLCEKILELEEENTRLFNSSEKLNDLAGSASSKSPDLFKKKETVSKNSEDILICQICMTKEKGIVFLPCGHLVSCSDCSDKVSICPICRRTIDNRIRTYLS